MGFKKSLFKLYVRYCDSTPFDFGKGTLTNFVGNYLGLAKFKIRDIKLELNPTALLDRYLIEGSEINSVLTSEMDSCLNEDNYFLDVGANIGYFSILAAIKYKAQVFAFEPSPRELKRLHRNIALNNCTQIICYPYGIGAKEETLHLNLTDFQNPSMNFITKVASTDSIPVVVKPIDQILNSHILEHIKLCKIDVEGFEMEVLKGMENSFNQMRGCHYVVEVSPKYLKKAGSNVSQIYDFFHKMDYKGIKGKQNTFQWDEVFVPRQ